MAKIEFALPNVLKFEYSKCSNALHKNKTESYPTFKGIYLAYYKHHPLANMVFDALRRHNYNYKKASKELCNNELANKYVMDIYKSDFWDKMKLDLVPQKVANDMMMFGVNAGTKNAIKLAQKVCDIAVDGIFGNQTLNALLSINEDIFDFAFDLEECKYYLKLIERKPHLGIYKNGWLRRAKYV